MLTGHVNALWKLVTVVLTYTRVILMYKSLGSQCDHHTRAASNPHRTPVSDGHSASVKPVVWVL